MMAGKNIILCLDGTWNGSFSIERKQDGRKVAKPTNVLKLARAIQKRNEQDDRQIVFYESGVGSLESFPGRANWLLKKTDNILGGVFGAGFETKIQNALTFISNNYAEGDSLYIFGFSRGAATARGICKILDWMGNANSAKGAIFSKNDAYYLPHSIRAYFNSKGEVEFSQVAKDFSQFSGKLINVEVKLLGVFDTVLSLGSRIFETPKDHLNSVELPLSVVNAIQALAIDESRKDFQPQIWETSDPDYQTLEQRWFSGSHSNIGGGYPIDGLANCTIAWFVKEAEALGLEFRHDYLGHYEPHPDSELYNSKTAMFAFTDLLRGHWHARPVKLAPPSISIDHSVIERTQQVASYRPENLINTLKYLSDAELDLLAQSLNSQTSKGSYEYYKNAIHSLAH